LITSRLTGELTKLDLHLSDDKQKRGHVTDFPIKKQQRETEEAARIKGQYSRSRVNT